jgi:hypothetical protein
LKHQQVASALTMPQRKAVPQAAQTELAAGGVDEGAVNVVMN